MTDQVHSIKLIKGKELLPIGSVVKVGNIDQAIMIYGRKQEQMGTNKIWDYVACPYPQGHISSDTNVFFNHEQVQEVIFKGLETEGEQLFREKLKAVFKEGREK